MQKPSAPTLARDHARADVDTEGAAVRKVLEQHDPTVTPLRYLNVVQAAAWTGFSPHSLANRAWREHVGLPVVRARRRVLFDVVELEAWLRGPSDRKEGGV